MNSIVSIKVTAAIVATISVLILTVRAQTLYPVEPVSPAVETTSGMAVSVSPDAPAVGPVAPAPEVGETMLLSFERISENVTDAQGNITAKMYMDKPVLSLEPFDLQDATVNTSSAAAVISRVNAYFEEEAKGFFRGSEGSKRFAERHYDDFFDSVAARMGLYGDGTFVAAPLYCTVDSEVAYMTRDILSIKQSLDWMAGGVRDFYYYGSTFDLNTGELLTLDRFVGAGREDFEAKVFAQLEKNFSVGIEEIHDYERFLAQLREKDIGEHEFYYDGQNIRLIFNEDIRPGMGFILRYR